MKKSFVHTLSAALVLFVVFAAGVAGRARAQINPPLYVVDKPTAGTLSNGSYQVRGRTGPESSFLLGIRVGFLGRIQVGASAGFRHVFANESPEFDDRVGLLARVRVLDETVFPALAVGFDSQGRGVYHSGLKRFDRKSPGFYFVLSKNYMLAVGDLSVHGGANLTRENRDDDDPNLFLGMDWTVLRQLSFLLDTDAALNDNAEGSPFGRGGAYVDAGVRWYFGESLEMTLIFRDLSGNSGSTRSVGREFELAFVEFF